MKWLEVKITTTEEAYDAVSEMLTSIGAAGVVVEDPNEVRREIERPGSLDYADDEFLNSLGEDVTVKAYFSEQSERSALVRLISEKLIFIADFLNIGKGSVDFSEIDDEDWSTAWKKHYKPFYLSERVVVKPSWEHFEKKQGDIVIELDPGMAFGTGTHETTRMCALMLERYLRRGDKVIDVGCGTGILSIIAVKLGAEYVTAVDVDEVAIRVTKENCGINGVEESVDAFRGSLGDVKKGKVNIVIANIIADVIIGMSRYLPYYLGKNDFFITSGIIKERKEEVINTYGKLNFEVDDIMEIGEWVAIAFKCRDSL